MQYCPLGKTGLVVSEVGFGAIPIIRLSFEEAVGVLRRAFDRGSDEVRVQLVCLAGERRDIPPGPRLTDEGFDGVVGRYPGPGLHSLRSALDCYTAENSELSIPPPHPYPADNADQIVDGRIMGQRIGLPVPWRANPLGVLEWIHFLHRHHFTKELVKMYARTGDDKYAATLDAIVKSWIHENPVPVGSNGGAGPAWETLSAAWRLREWLWIGGIVWRSSSFSAQTQKAMLRSTEPEAISIR